MNKMLKSKEMDSGAGSSKDKKGAENTRKEGLNESGLNDIQLKESKIYGPGPTYRNGGKLPL